MSWGGSGGKRVAGEGPNGPHIVGDLQPQGLGRWELKNIAEPLDEINLQRLSVEALAVVEQVDFDFGCAIAEGRVGSEVDRGPPRLAAEVRATGVDAWGGNERIDGVEVGRAEADLAAARAPRVTRPRRR